MIRRGGFTLLECLLALVIVSGVLIAILDMRADSLRQREKMAASQRADREAEALFQMFVTGSVGTPDINPQTRSVSWEGEFLGEPFRAVRTLDYRANPVLGAPGAGGAAGGAVRPTVPIFTYTLVYRGRVHEFDWIR